MSEIRSHPELNKPKRPFSVTLLALAVLTIAGLNLLRLTEAIIDWDFLAEVLPLSPQYLAASGLVWAVVWLGLFPGLWRGSSWAPAAVRIAVLAFSIYYWIDRLWIAKNMQPNWPFTVIFNLVIILIILWLLSRPRVKAFFGERYGN